MNCHRATSAGHRLRRGFTLLEVVLAMLVLAILMGIAVPTLRILGRDQYARTTVDNILACARYARSQAAAEGTTYRMMFDPVSGAYRLMRQEGYDFVPLGNEMAEVFEPPPGIRVIYLTPETLADELRAAEETGRLQPEALPSEFPYIDFRPNGRCDPAEIRVIDRDGRVTRLVIPSASETMRVIDETSGKVRE